MKTRVLIIEDDASSHELLRHLLETSCHATLSALDGAAPK